MRPTSFLLLLALSTACSTPPWQRDLEVTDLPPATPASLRGVSAVSTAIAWTSGTDGTCLRTLDGGASWLPCGPAATRGRDLRDVHAFDALNAVVLAVGSPALLLRTSDGGATWREVFRDDRPNAFLDGLDFLSTGVGFAFGDPVGGRFLVVRTRDGGQTWLPAAPAPPPLAGEAAFAASGTSVAVARSGTFLVATGGGEVARVLRGEERGARWQAHTTPLRAGTATRGAFSIAVSGNRGVVVGGDYQLEDAAIGNIAVSDDEGRTWRVPAGPPPDGYRSAVAFVPGMDGRVLVATGPRGIDLSRDGGESWQTVRERGFHALSFAPDGTGYAVGADGRMARLRLATREP